ncbi:MAG: sortase [Actinomycetota bacterium]|nr:sortase [Actinomycetota bacterium]MEA2931552.1 sortase [Actinomycetota bacterium]
MLINLLRTHRWIRVTLSGLSVVLLLGGVGLVGYPFFTNAWQSRIQAQLDDQLVSPELTQAYKEGKVETGDSLTRIRIPAIDVDVVVVEGITPSALRAGAGHYPQTALPCESGNVAIAGHRTTYGRPFGNLDELKSGDTIQLITPLGACEYRVSKAPFATPPTELGVIQPTPGKMVTLTTCHPKGSAAQRLVVQATWVQDIKAA